MLLSRNHIPKNVCSALYILGGAKGVQVELVPARDHLLFLASWRTSVT